MNKEKLQKLLVFLIISLIIIQPILDLYWLYNTKMGPFSLPTIIRIGFIIILGLVSLFAIKFNKKYNWLIAYIILIIIYTIFHHFNAYQTSSVLSNYDYNFIEEIFYIIRMIIPITMIYFTYHANISPKTFWKTIILLTSLIAGSIIFANIFKLSFGSYSDAIITGNIFEWFTNTSLGYTQTASRGFFFSSWVTAIMIIITPYIFYKFINDKNLKYLILILLMLLAMFMVGTKAVTYSFIIISIIMTALYFFEIIIKKTSNLNLITSIILILIITISFILIPYSPSQKRIQSDENYKTNQKNKDKSKTIEKDIINIIENEGYNKPTSVNEFIKSNPEDANNILILYFDKNFEYLGINEKFINQAYPYQYDPVFWYKIAKNEFFDTKMNNRFIQKAMYARIQNLNNKQMDSYLGLGFSKTSKIFTLEMDFIYQYYSMGIIGIILFLFPYIVIIIISGLLMLKYFKDKFNIENCALILGIGLTLCIAYYSGNVLDTLGVTIILGFFCGYLLKIINKKKEVENNDS